ncbi:plasminogen activator inhibitor 1 RNA-binding protein isoform X2 [Diabrotica virgifera virgifera]|uniref:Plasminogen activator inhibitor 1 RNA-binding protein-like isoform X2 n=1 Tax=Diabrotica virgifera virgifera TaxID=50390 RepID=A0A6P7FLV1_DIAVI|nr:plasminogen activator inhibitor 1 RNA-binding protein isoform X2 [Diabrotica virgifera virgifera]
MENTYGIGIANRYALFLDDESDPLETLTLKEQEKELKKKSKVAEKENKVKTPTIPKGKPTPAQKKPVKDVNHKPQENKRDETKPAPRNNVDGKPERSFNRFNNENREERNNRRNREDRPYNGPSENRDREERPRREPATGDFENRNNRDRGERREGREGRAIGNRPGAPRGQRRNFDGDRRGKREFDRQSGSDKTGVKPIDKRDGAGAHNWGSHKDVIEEADRPNTDANESWGDEVKIEPIETEKKEEGRPEEGRGGEEQTPVEEEPKELTLDEWKAQRAGRAKPQFNIRKAGEGEDPSQWKKMFELRKKEKDEETDEEEYDVSEYPQRVGRQKHLLDIEIQFNDSVRRGGGRGRGQRSGGPRGGGNRGGGTGGSGGGGGNRARESDRDRPERRYHNDAVDERNDARQAPKVDDERDFPSLG